MPEAEATLIGVGTSDPAARLTYLAVGADLIGESSALDAGGRLTDPVFIVPEDARQTPDLAAAADLPALEGDWTQFEQLDDLTQTHSGAKLVDGVWEVGEEYHQGSRMAGAEATGDWRWEDTGLEFPARYWDGVDTTTTHQKFHVDDAGNVRVAGSLAAGSIDVPSDGAAGFHVNASGGVNLGGTTAAGIAAGDMEAAGNITLTGSGKFRTAPSGQRIEISSNTTNRINFWFSASTVTAGYIIVPAENFIQLRSPEDATNTNEAYLTIASTPGVDPKGTISLEAGAVYFGEASSSSAIHIRGTGGATGKAGQYIIFPELGSAPGTATAGTLRVYAKSDGVYIKDDAGVETGPLGAGGGGSVATDAIWDAKGDLALGTGANTAIRLAVGADDTILMADAGAASGAKWVAAGTPSTQAFGDTAVVGTGDTFTRGDHKHAMPADPVTAHLAAGIHRSMVVQGIFLNLPAAQAAAIMSAGAAAIARSSAPWPGSVVGISIAVDSGQARLLGTATVEARINGVATGLTAVLDATNTIDDFGVQAAGLDTFVAGDRLELWIQSDATWSPVTADVTAQLWVEWSA